MEGVPTTTSSKEQAAGNPHNETPRTNSEIATTDKYAARLEKQAARLGKLAEQTLWDRSDSRSNSKESAVTTIELHQAAHAVVTRRQEAVNSEIDDAPHNSAEAVMAASDAALLNNTHHELDSSQISKANQATFVDAAYKHTEQAVEAAIKQNNNKPNRQKSRASDRTKNNIGNFFKRQEPAAARADKPVQQRVERQLRQFKEALIRREDEIRLRAKQRLEQAPDPINYDNIVEQLAPADERSAYADLLPFGETMVISPEELVMQTREQQQEEPNFELDPQMRTKVAAALAGNTAVHADQNDNVIDDVKASTHKKSPSTSSASQTIMQLGQSFKTHQVGMLIGTIVVVVLAIILALAATS